MLSKTANECLFVLCCLDDILQRELIWQDSIFHKAHRDGIWNKIGSEACKTYIHPKYIRCLWSLSFSPSPFSPSILTRSPSLSLLLTLCLSVCLSVFLSLCISLSVSLCLYTSLSFSVSIFVSLRLSLTLYVYTFLLSVFLECLVISNKYT